jgi:hypothetical protein
MARELRLGDDKHNQANSTPLHRKKYFSSSERERIAQQGLLIAPPVQENTRVRSRSRKPTPEPCHISTLPDDWKPNSDRKVKQSMTSSLLRPRRRYHPQPNTELNQQQPTVSQDQAAWFLALPDKVKRQHFSKEEQVLLAHRCEIVLGSKAAKVKQESTQEYVRRRLLEFDFLSDSSPRAKPRKESAQDFCRRQLFEQSEGGPVVFDLELVHSKALCRNDERTCGCADHRRSGPNSLVSAQFCPSASPVASTSTCSFTIAELPEGYTQGPATACKAASSSRAIGRQPTRDVCRGEALQRSRNAKNSTSHVFA